MRNRWLLHSWTGDIPSTSEQSGAIFVLQETQSWSNSLRYNALCSIGGGVRWWKQRSAVVVLGVSLLQRYSMQGQVISPVAVRSVS